MKLNKFALTLTAAALLPTFTFAGTDQVAASFERDLQRGMNIESVAVAKAGSVDPLVYAIDVALNGHSDQVLASFERDLHRVPTIPGVVLTASAEVDPLPAAINVALWGEAGKPAVSIATAGGHHHGS